MLSQMLSAAWRPHRLTTMRAPGHTLHHGPRAICAKRAKYGEISLQSGKEGKKTGAKVPPSCGVATSGRRCDRRRADLSRQCRRPSAKDIMVSERSRSHQSHRLDATLDHSQGQLHYHFLPAHCGPYLNSIEGFWRVLQAAIG